MSAHYFFSKKFERGSSKSAKRKAEKRGKICWNRKKARKVGCFCDGLKNWVNDETTYNSSSQVTQYSFLRWCFNHFQLQRTKNFFVTFKILTRLAWKVCPQLFLVNCCSIHLILSIGKVSKFGVWIANEWQKGKTIQQKSAVSKTCSFALRNLWTKNGEQQNIFKRWKVVGQTSDAIYFHIQRGTKGAKYSTGAERTILACLQAENFWYFVLNFVLKNPSYGYLVASQRRLDWQLEPNFQSFRSQARNEL